MLSIIVDNSNICFFIFSNCVIYLLYVDPLLEEDLPEEEELEVEDEELELEDEEFELDLVEVLSLLVAEVSLVPVFLVEELPLLTLELLL